MIITEISTHSKGSSYDNAVASSNQVFNQVFNSFAIWFVFKIISKYLRKSSNLDNATPIVKRGSHLPIKFLFGFICFNERLLKIMENACYFMLKAVFILKIFKFLSWLFWSCRKTAWKPRWVSKCMTFQSRKQISLIHMLPNISKSKGNQTIKFLAS